MYTANENESKTEFFWGGVKILLYYYLVVALDPRHRYILKTGVYTDAAAV